MTIPRWCFAAPATTTSDAVPVPAGGGPAAPQHMLPPPRDLALRVPHWRAEQLFYIVKHGMRFTVMPALPSQQRDDDVWAVVAFLQRLLG